MCTYSMIANDWFNTNPQWTEPLTYTVTVTPSDAEQLRAEMAELREQLEALKKLLIAAKIYDKETKQADCEDAEKVKLLRRLAELCGVDPGEAF